MRIPRSLVSLVIALLVGGAAAASLVQDKETAPPPAPADPQLVHLAALDRASLAADRLPSWYSELPASEHMVTAEAKLTGTLEDKSYYLVPGLGPTTCLIYVTELGESAGTCAATASIGETGLYFTEVGGAGEEAALTALAMPDGFDTVASDTEAKPALTGENLVVLIGPPPSELTISGPEGVLHWHIGRQTPP